jgi:hypothetical protein
MFTDYSSALRVNSWNKRIMNGSPAKNRIHYVQWVKDIVSVACDSRVLVGWKTICLTPSVGQGRRALTH